VRAREWVAALRQFGPEQRALFRQLYGPDEALHAERRQAWLAALEKFARTFGEEREVLLARAPGRVNLMGRHIDHRGGDVNPIALSREVLVVASGRSDDTIVAHNVDEAQYPPRQFSIAAELPESKVSSLEEWDRWTAAKFQERQRAGTAREWINYVKAAAVYFQNRFREPSAALSPRLCGMDAVFSGNVPPMAGLSSSSALFVAAAEALLALNGVSLSEEEFIAACGEGEWYVGTRGGSGDHAAIKLGRAGQVSHISFAPFSVDYAPLPEEYRVVIANSLVQAHKAGGARDVFNSRVAAYELGLLLLHRRFAELAPRMPRLRDVNPRALGVSESHVLRMLAALPERATRAELCQELLAGEARLEEIFASHSEPKEGYALRGVCLFGVAECERARLAPRLLERGDVERFGRMMSISHDGDRVARTLRDGRQEPFAAPTSGRYLGELAERWERGEGDGPRALAELPGAYACSVPEIDLMVDVAQAVPGVVGAQISGAGLGGSMMALVRAPCAEDLVRALAERYYEPRDLPVAVEVCLPVAGSGAITSPARQGAGEI